MIFSSTFFPFFWYFRIIGGLLRLSMALEILLSLKKVYISALSLLVFFCQSPQIIRLKPWISRPSSFFELQSNIWPFCPFLWMIFYSRISISKIFSCKPADLFHQFFLKFLSIQDRLLSVRVVARSRLKTKPFFQTY